MKTCMCSIFDTREERIIEEDGRNLRRLICNVCGRVLDTIVDSDTRTLRKRRIMTGESEQSEGEALSF
jgi:hypothetical protein